MFLFFLCKIFPGHAIKLFDLDSSLQIVERLGAVERLNSLFAKAAIPAREHFLPSLFKLSACSHIFLFCKREREVRTMLVLEKRGSG